MELNPAQRIGLRAVAAVAVIAIALRIYAFLPASNFPVNLGMTRDEVQQVAGSTYRANGDVWLYRGNHWYSDPRVVTFDSHGTVVTIE